MIVQVSTDRNIDGHQEFADRMEAEVTARLARFGDRLTRVEVHFGDENGARGGADDKRCTIEARPAGRPPVAVTHHAATPEEACRGAVGKVRTLLERTFGRLDAVKGSDSIRVGPSLEPVDLPTEDARPVS